MTVGGFMKKSLFAVTVAASLTLVGCGGASTGKNANPDPKYTDTNPVASADVQYPGGFVLDRYVSADGGVQHVKTYLTYDPDFSSESLKQANFILDGGTALSDHVKAGSLMTVSAYNPTLNLILSDVVGVMPNADTAGYTADLNPLSTAITHGVVKDPKLSVSDGVADDIARLSLADTTTDAAIVALQMDGYSATDAAMATETVKITALEAALSSQGAKDDIQRLFNAHFDGTLWQGGDSSTLKFKGNTVTFSGFAGDETGTYVVTLKDGAWSMVASFPVIGTQTLDLTNFVPGKTDKLNLMGQSYTQQ